MELPSLITLLIFIISLGVGSYLQTWLGFGFGIIVMGVVGGLHLIQIPILALVVNFLALSNNFYAMQGRWKDLDIKKFLYCLSSLILLIPIGVLCLAYLNSHAVHFLRATLGILIFGAGVLLVCFKKSKPNISKPIYFIAIGALSGFLGGLFSLGTIPLVYFFLQQPLSLNKIRALILSLACCLTTFRIISVLSIGTLSMEIFFYVALGMPFMWLGSYLSKRHPIQVSLQTTRRTAFAIFTLLGLLLVNNS